MAVKISKPRILFVDDNKDMRTLLHLHLSNAGYDVWAAEDAIEAGKIVLHSVPDLMVVDVALPFMSGIEFVSTIIADQTIPTFPVIFATGHAEFADRAEALG